MISDYRQNVWSQDEPLAAHVDHVVSGLPNICPGRFGTLLIASLVFKCDQPYLDARGMSPAGRRSCFPTKPCLGIEVCNLTSSAGKVSLVEVSRNVVFVLGSYTFHGDSCFTDARFNSNMWMVVFISYWFERFTFYKKTMVSGRFPLKHPKDIQCVVCSIFMVRIMNPGDSSTF